MFSPSMGGNLERLYTLSLLSIVVKSRTGFYFSKPEGN